MLSALSMYTYLHMHVYVHYISYKRINPICFPRHGIDISYNIRLRNV